MSVRWYRLLHVCRRSDRACGSPKTYQWANPSLRRPRIARTARCSAACIVGTTRRARRSPATRASRSTSGALCVKGWTAAGDVDHPDGCARRSSATPTARLVPASWDDALDRIAVGFSDIQARHGARRGRRLRQRLADQREGLPPRQVRPRRARHREHRLQRPLLHVVGGAAASNRAFGLDRGLPFPLEDISRRRRRPARRQQPGRDDAAAHAVLRGAAAPAAARSSSSIRGGSATAQWATLHLQLRPGSDAALANGLLHVLHSRRPDRRGATSRRAPRASTRSARVAAAYWPERVERITGVPEAELVAAAHCSARRRGDGAHRRAAPSSRRRASTTRSPTSTSRWRSARSGRPCSGFGMPHRPGQRPGRPRARPEGRPAARLSLDRRSRRRGGTSPASGASAESTSRARQVGLRAAPIDAARTAASARCSSWVRTSRSRRRTPCAIEERLAALDFLVVVRLLPVRDGARWPTSCCRRAQWAEEDGTMTNLEGRVIRCGARVARRRAASRTDIEIPCRRSPTRSASGTSFAVEQPARRLRRAAPRHAGGAGRLLGHHLRADRRSRTASSGRARRPTHPGTPRLFVERFATPSGRARFHAVDAPADRPKTPDADSRSILTTGRVLAQYQSGTQTRRIAGAEAMLAPEPSRRCTRRRRARLRRAPTAATVVADDAPRRGRRSAAR